jgi:hypothetical protein
MHTGVISFCDRIHFNVKCSAFKELMLNRMEGAYGVRILQRHWHRFEVEGGQGGQGNDGRGGQGNGGRGFQSISPGLRPQEGSHWMCLRSNGNPYFLVLTTLDDVPTMVYVDKKVQPGYEYPRMILGRGQFPVKAFKGAGTVLDGEMVRDVNGGWAYLVNDVIAYAGEVLYGVNCRRRLTLQQRLERARELIGAKRQDPHMDSCVYQVKRYFAPTQEGFTALIESAADYPYTQRGLYFWPDGGNNPRAPPIKPKLYNFDETIIKPVVRKVKDAPEFFAALPSVAATVTVAEATSESIMALHGPIEDVMVHNATIEVPRASIEVPRATIEVPRASVEGPTRKLWLRKTENPDIYDVSVGESATSAKIGIAGVPTLSISKMLRAIFRSRTVAQPACFECTWHEGFQKYVPLQACT